MANNLKMANQAVNTEADAFAAQCNSGFIRIYDGAQPATSDTAITTQVLLAELTMNATAFGSSVAGVLTANAITADSAANASGTATWYRLVKSDGVTSLCDGSVGTASADMTLNSVIIGIGAQVSITSFTHTVPKA